MAKLRVAVLFGGVSSEHEVSCVSGAAIVDHMDPERYEVLKVGITKKGRWLLWPGGAEGMRDGSWETSPDCVPAFIAPDATTRGLVVNQDGAFEVLKLDVVFPALHGPMGEDGTVQGLLELAGLPYVGCGVLASATSMDKSAANAVFEKHNIPHTPWMAIGRDEIEDQQALLARLRERIAFPMFIKPASAGSSVGVTKVQAPEALHEALLIAAAHDATLIIEQAVDGQEVECAVLGNQNPSVTVPGEIVSCNESYDYEAKYHSGDASKLHIPARLPAEKQAEVRELALKAYKALGCQGLARVDFFVQREDGRVLISEVNTLPGFTPISMYPKLMDHSGISFSELVDRLIALGMERAGV